MKSKESKSDCNFSNLKKSYRLEMELITKLTRMLPTIQVLSVFGSRSLAGKLIQPVIEPFPTLPPPIYQPEVIEEPIPKEEPVILPEVDQGTLSSLIFLLKSKLCDQVLFDFTRGIISIQKRCKGDGAGLTSGVITDMFINDFFHKVFKDQYQESHVGECDLILNGIPISLKKIKGKSIIALDWSKNNSDSQRERFTHPIMILNTKTMKWKRNILESGIYLVDHNYCKQNIELSKNNKTDSLITSDYLQKMLEYSISEGTFYCFPFPEENDVEPYRFI